MPLTAAAVIDAARDLHPALSEQNAPAALLRRELSRRQDALVQDIERVVPGAFVAVVTVPLPLPSFVDGIDLAAAIPEGWKVLTLVEVVWANGNVQSCAWEAADRPGVAPWPWVRLQGKRLYLGGAERDWSQATSLRITYTPVPAALTTGTAPLLLPDDALEPLAWALAAFALMRLVSNPEARVSGDVAAAYRTDAAQQWMRYLDRWGRMAPRQQYVVRDVSRW